MKIWCDVCSGKEATIFCPADEAALCDACDVRVHQANKLASKHPRFSLLQPSSSSQPPRCDICQEKKALLFCQQDRAILCRDCDLQIHTSNDLTRKHSRFLLTGAKVDSLASAPQTSTTHMNFKPQAATHDADSPLTGGGGSTSSISEYLIETLPGWQVEDLLNSCSDPIGFTKDEDLVFMNTGLWVPQAPTVPQPSPFNSTLFGVKENQGGKRSVGRKISRWEVDDGFTVPQMSPQSLGSKRFRPFC